MELFFTPRTVQFALVFLLLGVGQLCRYYMSRHQANPYLSKSQFSMMAAGGLLGNLLGAFLCIYMLIN